MEPAICFNSVSELSVSGLHVCKQTFAQRIVLRFVGHWFCDYGLYLFSGKIFTFLNEFMRRKRRMRVKCGRDGCCFGREPRPDLDLDINLFLDEDVLYWC